MCNFAVGICAASQGHDEGEIRANQIVAVVTNSLNASLASRIRQADPQRICVASVEQVQKLIGSTLKQSTVTSFRSQQGPRRNGFTLSAC